MKQFFAEPVDESVILSMEEEALVDTQIDADVNAIGEIAAAVARAEDTTKAVEDMLVVATDPLVEGTTVADATIELMSAANAMVMAGVDADPAVPVPAVAAALESIDDVMNWIKKVWKTISDLVIRIVGHIKSFFNSYRTVMVSYKGKLNSLRHEIANAPGKVDFEAQIHNASRNGTQPKSMDGIHDNWTILEKFVEEIVGPISDGNLKSGKLIQDLMASASKSIKDQSAIDTAMNTFVQKSTALAVSYSSKSVIKVAGKDVMKFSEVLPGDHQLVVKVGDISRNPDSSALVKIQDYMSGRYELTDTGKAAGAASIPVKDKQHVLAVIDIAEKVLDHVIEHTGGGARNLEDQTKRMRSTAEKLVADIGRTTDLDAYSRDCVQTFLRLNKTFVTSSAQVNEMMCRVVKEQLAALESFCKIVIAHLTKEQPVKA